MKMLANTACLFNKITVQNVRTVLYYYTMSVHKLASQISVQFGLGQSTSEGNAVLESVLA